MTMFLVGKFADPALGIMCGLLAYVGLKLMSRFINMLIHDAVLV